ncbi:fatty acid desaturase [Cognatishimia activa]|uniref:Fatty acid desaturase n=1 Tax=Cognatishimia activa TaxID=1715691 RepID=A0A975I8S2_9RHOB|nr:fatty acid desaturase [Cognatishimia activa]QTN36161.1 fatty acid desaturase [Cognatishimia activa]
MRKCRPLIEWPTFLLLVLCYAGFALGTIWASSVWLPLGMAVTTIAIVLHSSLTHEVVHGHPFRSQLLSEATVFPVLGVFIPYLRFKDTHLDHHQDSKLTDPYDDPESNYMDPEAWSQLSFICKALLTVNNTLFGRIVLGPAIGQIVFMKCDATQILKGNRRVLAGWLLHIPGLALVFWFVASVSAMPVWAYLICAYIAYGVLKIRTFLEHQAHEKYRGRTVIIEDHGPLAWLFLYNSLHVVHHMHPKLPWYRLPVAFKDNRDRYLGRNDGYYYSSYWTILKRYFFTPKDPVPHPLWPKR